MNTLIDYFIRWPLLWLFRLLLMYHYKVHTNNKEALRGFRGGLIAFGHSALSDPVITTSQIWPLTKARPVVYSGQYKLYPRLMALVRAFPINSPKDGNGDWQRRTIQKQLEAVRTALESGDNIMISPAGQIKVGIKEHLGTKSGVYDLVKTNPGAPLLLVRIRGLHGSVLSKYFTGTTDLPTGAHMLQLIKQNWATFLLPFNRTSVDLDFERIDNVPAEALESVLAFNAWLEAWYNAVPDQLIPGRDGASFKTDFVYGVKSETEEVAIDELVFTRVKSFLQTEFKIDSSAITLDADLESLGIDSLGQATLPLLVAETFGVTVSDTVELEHVRDVVLAAQGLFTDTAEETVSVAAPLSWQEPSRPLPQWLPNSQSLVHAYLLTRDRVGGTAVACGGTNALGVDEVRTYREKLARAMLIADHIKRMPGEYIGLMLPATVAADVVALAILLTGKVVVPFNWTAGATALDQAIFTSDVQVIISSEVFLTQVQASFTENTMGKIVTLETLLAGSISTKTGTALRLVRGRLLARLPAPAIRVLYDYTMDADDTAVVLFTSGSESAPKGVPLSHRNVMACVKGALAAIDGKPNEVMLAFLPAFHSFGFSMEMMLCATTGVKIAYEPDPKRYRRLAAAAEKWHATLIPGTPDFIAGILDVAHDPVQQFATVRAVLTGAQKAPQALKDQVAALGKDYFEGYGITETAPLVAVTRPGETPVGVGKPIDGVRVVIVGIEPDATGTYVRREEGQEGRIFVAGDTVFGGYMGGVQDPFVDLEGIRYYNTGDLGFVDAAGNLTISGRLKRFIKVAGEMVSLPAVEDVLVSHWPSGESGPMVAIDGVESADGGAGIICLYAADARITLAEAHAVLRAAGVVGRSWPRYLKLVSEIPLLGTGKVNYRALPPPRTVAETQAIEAVA